MLPIGLLQAGTFAILLIGWARHLDRRPLRDYGLSLSGSWVAHLAGAFVAVIIAHIVWYGLGISFGWTTVSVMDATSPGALVPGLVAILLAVTVNVWVQDTAFFGIVLQSAAEGLQSRGLDLTHAVLGGWLVGIIFVVGIHDAGVDRMLGLAVAGALFGLLYLHTGELALSIGFHAGVNFSGGWLFPTSTGLGDRTAVFAVTESLPLLSNLSAPRIPQMVIAYLLIVAWLYWRHGTVGLQLDIATCPEES